VKHFIVSNAFPFFPFSTTFFLGFFWYWGLNSGPHICWAGAVPLEPVSSPSNNILWNILTSSLSFPQITLILTTCFPLSLLLRAKEPISFRIDRCHPVSKKAIIFLYVDWHYFLIKQTSSNEPIWQLV
jgi:hypothetical protein